MGFCDSGSTSCLRARFNGEALAPTYDPFGHGHTYTDRCTVVNDSSVEINQPNSTASAIDSVPCSHTRTNPTATPVPTISAFEPTATLSPTIPAPQPTATPAPTFQTLMPTSQPIQGDEEPEDTIPAMIQELRFLALGDSYTIGQNVDVSERWPVQLAKRLREEGLVINDPEIIARTGWTSSDLAQGIAEVNPSGPYGLVTLMIGVNNQFRGLAIERYRMEFSALLQQAIHFAGGDPSRVIVVSTPDWGVTPLARVFDRVRIAREIDALNLVTQEETAQVGAVFVDVTEVSRALGSQPNMLAFDALHPSGDMYRLWVDLIFPATREIASKAAAGG